MNDFHRRHFLSRFQKFACQHTRVSFFKKTATMVQNIGSADEFAKVLAEAGDKVVLVDFFATWCGPCRAIAPKLEEFSRTYAANLIVIKVDVDELEDLAQEKEISAMPTFQLYKRGQKVGELTGANKEKLEELIKANI